MKPFNQNEDTIAKVKRSFTADMKYQNLYQNEEIVNPSSPEPRIQPRKNTASFPRSNKSKKSDKNNTSSPKKKSLSPNK